MAAQIYLIGTSHADFKGAKRLERILCEFQPDTLFVEGSEKLYQLAGTALQKQEEIMVNKLQNAGRSSEIIESFKKFLTKTQYYEIPTCKQYAKNNFIL